MCRVVKAISLGLVFQASTYAAGNLVNGPDADLVYDFRSGDVSIDISDLANTNLFVGFALQNDQASFRTENTTFPFVDIGSNTTNTTSFIGQTKPTSDDNPPEILPLGEVFPIGMSNIQSLSEYLTDAGYSIPFEPAAEFDLVVVSEPNGELGLVFAFSAVQLIRRRKPLAQ